MKDFRTPHRPGFSISHLQPGPHSALIDRLHLWRAPAGQAVYAQLELEGRLRRNDWARLLSWRMAVALRARSVPVESTMALGPEYGLARKLLCDIGMITWELISTVACGFPSL